MKFTKDKKYSFISTSESFKANWEVYYTGENGDKIVEKTYTEKLRWEIDNYRGFAAYDKPMCESGAKANYVLSLTYKKEFQGREVWLTWHGNEWNFETKKEMMNFLNTYMEYMKKGEKGNYGYYNSDEFKIV